MLVELLHINTGVSSSTCLLLMNALRVVCGWVVERSSFTISTVSGESSKGLLSVWNHMLMSGQCVVCWLKLSSSDDMGLSNNNMCWRRLWKWLGIVWWVKSQFFVKKGQNKDMTEQWPHFSSKCLWLFLSASYRNTVRLCPCLVWYGVTPSQGGFFITGTVSS